MPAAVHGPALPLLGLIIGLMTVLPAHRGVAQCGDNIILNPGFEDVGPPCGTVPPNGLINGAFNLSCVDPWQAAWGTPSVCAFDVYAGQHVACFGSNNEGMFQDVPLDPDPCGPYTLTFWYRGISGLNGNLHVYLANGLVNVPTSNSGNPPLVIQPDWDLLAIVPVTNTIWQQAVIPGVEASDPANTQLLFLDVPTGTLDVSVDEVFLGYLPPDPAEIGFSVACVDQEGATYTLSAVVTDPPPGYDPDQVTWNFGDGNTASGTTVTHTFTLEGTYTVCATLADDCGCAVETCTTITVDACACACGTDDIPPVFTSLPTLLVEVSCASDIPAIPTLDIFDACDLAPSIEYAETDIGSPCDRTITRIWTASDACGNTAIAAQVIRVEDQEPPEWIVEPSDITVACDDVDLEFAIWLATYAAATAADNCDGVTLTVETISTPGMTCATAQAAFIATDACGNAIQRIATFTVANAPPEILVPATDLASPCGIPAPEVVNAWLLSHGNAVAAADCGDPAWSNNFTTLAGDSTAVTFTAENTCGLTESTIAWIIAGDIPPPVFDTIFTCDSASVGNDTSLIENNGCLVQSILTNVYRAADTTVLVRYICDDIAAPEDTLFLSNRYGCDSLVIRREIKAMTVYIENVIVTCRPDTVATDPVIKPGFPCDTIVLISIIVTPADETFIRDTVCDPALAGSDVLVFTRPSGCDSIVYMDHIYLPPPTRLSIVDSCGPGADYTDTLRVPGIPCDSLVLTQYRFHPNVLTERTLSTCDPAMPASDTLALTSIFGCDSTVITTYVFRPADTTYIRLETCDPTQVTSDTILLQDSGGCDSLIIRTTTHAGVDTIRVQAETCDPAAAGTTITVRPGMPCDTVVKTTTLLVPSLIRRDTIEACGRGFPVTDTLRFTSSFGCDSLVYRTTIFKRIFAQLEGIFETCAGDDDGAIELVAVQGGKPPYLASLNGGPFTAGQAGAFPRFDDLAPGPYTIVVRDADGCQDTSDMLLTSGQLLAISAGADIFAAPGTIVEMSGTTSDPFGSWQWTATDPFSCDTCLSTMLGPLTTAQWAVLSGITSAGCTAVDSVFIRLRADVDWYVPNVFSPNGDGLNDVFRPVVSDDTAIILRFEIYDRLGGLLFAIRDAQPASIFQGWDGTMNGQPAAPGVYVYVLIFSAPGLDETRVSGDVTLLR